ncbi:MAG: hypothetical protein WAR79_01275 [Melioribacteraceae bacterium]
MRSNGFDSMSIIGSAKHIKNINADYFEEIFRTSFSSDEKYDFLEFNSADFFLGLDYIKIDFEKDIFKLKISAKSTQKDYLKGLNANSFENALENIRKYGILDFHVNNFIDSATVLSADLSENIKLSQPTKKYICDLALIGAKEGYHLIKINEETVILSSGTRSNKKSIIAYDKYVEVSRNNKSNRELWTFVNIDLFKNVLKVEGKLKSFENCRRYFQLPAGEELKLTTLLNSKVNALSNYLIELTDYKSKIKTISAPVVLEKSLNDFIKDKGFEKLLEDCGNDINLAKTIIKSKIKGNPSRDLRRLREVNKLRIGKATNWDFSSIEEIINKLES